MSEEQVSAGQNEENPPEQLPSNEPSAADLDAVASEQQVKTATESPDSGQSDPLVAATQLTAQAGAGSESPANLQDSPTESVAAEAPKPAPMCRCGATLKPSSQASTFNYECPAISCKLRWRVTDSGQECIGRGAVA